MSSADLSDRSERVKQLLLLAWVHGFKGNQASFADFPTDVSEAVQKRYSAHTVHSVIYPKYKTVGELDVATHNFVLWLYHHIHQLEREEVDKNGQMVHTSVILLGHSMGGMLVADAAKAVRDDLKQDKGEGGADIKGIMGLDTPFIGIHPALVSYGMEQLDAYIDKTLLDTAAFFESSPKFIRQGLSKMGIQTPTKPMSSTCSSTLSPPVPEKPVGRLEKGFTSVLSVPGTASSTEWDWTREPGFGLKKVWSGVSGRSSRSSLNRGESSRSSLYDGERSSRRTSETPPIPMKDGTAATRTPPTLPPRPGSAARLALSSDTTPHKGAPETSDRSRYRGDTAGSDPSSAVTPEGAVRSLVQSKLQVMGKSPSTDEIDDPVSATSTDKSEEILDGEQIGKDPEAVPPTQYPAVNAEMKAIIDDTSTGGASHNDTLSTQQDDPVTASLNIGKSLASGVPPPLPKRASSNSNPLNSSSLSPDRSDPSSNIQHSKTVPSDSTAVVHTTAKEKQKKNWRWVKQHTDFMSSCWSVSGIAKRMKAIDGMQREGLHFVNIYTTVPPLPGKTFVSLPTIHHPTKESWKPFIHPTAGDQVEAHMALFDREKNGGYEDLIRMLGSEVGLILGEKPDGLG